MNTGGDAFVLVVNARGVELGMATEGHIKTRTKSQYSNNSNSQFSGSNLYLVANCCL